MYYLGIQHWMSMYENGDHGSCHVYRHAVRKQRGRLCQLLAFAHHQLQLLVDDNTQQPRIIIYDKPYNHHCAIGTSSLVQIAIKKDKV